MIEDRTGIVHPMSFFVHPPSLGMPDALRDEVHEALAEVANWLIAPGSALAELEPEIRPFGAWTFGLEQARADGIWEVEAAIDLPLRESACPRACYRHIGRRLAGHPAYLKALRGDGNCWRLSLPIGVELKLIPALPDLDRVAGSLFVPDATLTSWERFNPRAQAS